MWGQLMSGMMNKLGGKGGSKPSARPASVGAMDGVTSAQFSGMPAYGPNLAPAEADTSWGSLLGAQGGLGTKGRIAPGLNPVGIQQGYMGDTGAVKSSIGMLPKGYKDVSQWASPGTLISYLKNMPQQPQKKEYTPQGTYMNSLMGGYL